MCVRPDQTDGEPCIQNLRVPVATVVGVVADGMTETEILGAYPDLETKDARKTLRYVAVAVCEHELPLLAAS